MVWATVWGFGYIFLQTHMFAMNSAVTKSIGMQKKSDKSFRHQTFIPPLEVQCDQIGRNFGSIDRGHRMDEAYLLD
jgi:hypothetical protein